MRVRKDFYSLRRKTHDLMTWITPPPEMGENKFRQLL